MPPDGFPIFCFWYHLQTVIWEICVILFDKLFASLSFPIILQQTLIQYWAIIIRMLKTPGHKLREEFMRTQALRPNHDDDQYLEQLKKLGVEPHPTIFPAFFPLKNDLLYPGMATSQPIHSGEVLVKVPQSLILSSAKALRQPALADIFSEQFYKGARNWQDRVLITYCLYLHSVSASDNIFYHMVQHFSKAVDIAIFWAPEELETFRDKHLIGSAKFECALFDKEWLSFCELREKYELLQSPSFDKQNYRWIFTHVNSRCFGKKMDKISFVPFCEFFNHHASTVSYQINAMDEEYKENKSETSSIDSSESDEEYIEEGEFDYELIQVNPLEWEPHPAEGLDPNELTQVNSYAKRVLERVELQINWKDFSIIFVGQLIDRIKYVQNEYVKGVAEFKNTFLGLQECEHILEKYVLLVKAFYSVKHGKRFNYKIHNNQKQINKPISKKGKYMSPEEAANYVAPYTELTLKTGRKDRFQENSQVYFRYGKNSNTHLLLNYGFAIQGNPFESVVISYDLDLNLQQMPDLFAKMQQFGLALRRRFKLHHYRFNIELIIFHRLNSWNLINLNSVDQVFYVFDLGRQFDILDGVIDSVKSKMEELSGDDDLTDKGLNYHQYFIAVYHIEQKRILTKQLALLEKAKAVLERMSEGESRVAAEESILDESDKSLLKDYLDSIVQ